MTKRERNNNIMRLRASINIKVPDDVKQIMDESDIGIYYYEIMRCMRYALDWVKVRHKVCDVCLVHSYFTAKRSNKTYYGFCDNCNEYSEKLTSIHDNREK